MVIFDRKFYCPGIPEGSRGVRTAGKVLFLFQRGPGLRAPISETWKYHRRPSLDFQTTPWSKSDNAFEVVFPAAEHEPAMTNLYNAGRRTATILLETLVSDQQTSISLQSQLAKAFAQNINNGNDPTGFPP